MRERAPSARSSPRTAGRVHDERDCATRDRAADPALRPPWLAGAPGEWIISVWAQPGARGTGIQGVVDGSLKIRVSAPAVDGKANDALLRWIAERLELPQRSVRLAAGDTSRRKRVQVQSTVDAQVIVERLVGAAAA